MHKHLEGIYDSKEYAIQQLHELQRDMKNVFRELSQLEDNFTMIECGLRNKHDFHLDRFESNFFPLCNPPGMYFFKCRNCGERIGVKACEHELVKFQTVIDNQKAQIQNQGIQE